MRERSTRCSTQAPAPGRSRSLIGWIHLARARATWRWLTSMKTPRFDIAITNWGNPGSVGIHLGNGDGTFGGGVTFETAPGPRGLAVGDINGDGDLDLAIAIEGYTGVDLSIVSVLLGNGDG